MTVASPAGPVAGPVSLSFFSRWLPSPLGPLLLLTDASGRVRALEFEQGCERLRRLLARHDPHHTLEEAPQSGAAAAEALVRYFDGELGALDALPVTMPGSPLQRRVWAALRTIAVGQVMTYGDLARRVGQDGAAPAAEAGLESEIAAFQANQRAGRLARAVGRANSLNPVSIIVPCHRVIGANGRLTGYAGGLARKQWLLVHERAVRDAATPRLEGF